jgi:anti-sigma-K factor RskA
MTPTPGFGGADLPPRDHDEWRAAAAAYALDALDAAEGIAFAAHLETCAECRALVASYTPVVASLGLATDPMTPPDALRARTLARATNQPRSTPAITDRTPLEARDASPAPRLARQAAPSWWLVAASLTAAIGLGIYSWSLRQQVSVLRSMVSQASVEVRAVRAELASVRGDSTQLVSAVRVLTAADLYRVDLAGQAGASAASARAFVSQSRGLMFSAEHLPALAAGHVYQVWVLAPTPMSAGVLTPARDGSATVTMPMPNDVTLAAIAAVAVTEEPNPQGSLTPTMPILLVGNMGR